MGRAAARSKYVVVGAHPRVIREDAGRDALPARPAWHVHISRNPHSRSARQRPWVSTWFHPREKSIAPLTRPESTPNPLRGQFSLGILEGLPGEGGRSRGDGTIVCCNEGGSN
jgi:hypothetical protein